MYASETWTVTLKQENTLNCFERRIQRNICGPMHDGDVWRHRTNGELREIFGSENIVGAIKSTRLRWAGHVMRMQDDRAGKKILLKQPDGVRAKGTPRKKWIDCVEGDLNTLGVTNWKIMTEDRLQWRQVVESANTRLG